MRALLLAVALLLAPPSFAFGTQQDVGTLPTVTVIRRLAGPPGTTITATRGALTLVATSQPSQGTEELAVTLGEPWTASWVSGGTTFTVTITQLPGETDDHASERLDRKVRAMQRRRPPDGSSTGPLPTQQ